jgi:hypothetical protein
MRSSQKCSPVPGGRCRSRSLLKEKRSGSALPVMPPSPRASLSSAGPDRLTNPLGEGDKDITDIMQIIWESDGSTWATRTTMNVMNGEETAMSDTLHIDKARALIENLKISIVREECRDCECLQGVLVQIEIVSDEDASELTGPLKVPPARMHSCLGCDPCPPAEIFGHISCFKK